jgi:hypothetical protein
MYLLTIRDGLNTRYIGPYDTPKQAAEHLDDWLALCGERAHWQIHQLESPACRPRQAGERGGDPAVAA